MEMIDWGILVLIAISTLIGLWRGAVREIISLATWVIAAIVGFKYNHLLIPFYSAFTAHETLQLIASFLTLVILIVIIGTILGVTLSEAISKIGLGMLDRVLGLGFGGARGILIIALVILFARNTEIPSQEQWKKSLLIPQFDVVVDYINQWIKDQGYEPFGKKSQDHQPSEHQPQTPSE